ncbi:sideroflexin-2-like isoform X1 [Tachypleus tridentatus]|uniref:sideroflexin-2-like isoform X1 n=1 Tax=Tachypleus tridentatus TaxID=6853 RepID=UPI003FD644DF
MDETVTRVNLDAPCWDQTKFIGRLKYFFSITDPRHALASEEQLYKAKELLALYRLGKEPLGTTNEQVLYAKKLYESAFHPDSGELQNVFGRMSFQVPGGMAITGCMLQFYRTTSAVVFWQWVNQSFNALVNYTNRNAQSELSLRKIAFAYISATTSAVITAVGLKNFLKHRASSLMQRFVPFAAVAAANCVNIPLMRQSELTDGIAVFDDNGQRVTESKVAAAKAISQVVFSRIFMAAPGMILCPVIMENIEKYRWMKQVKPFHAPIQTLIVGCFLIFMVPIGCALFPQRCSLKIESLQRWEPEKYAVAIEMSKVSNLTHVYFNKGL